LELTIDQYRFLASRQIDNLERYIVHSLRTPAVVELYDNAKDSEIKKSLIPIARDKIIQLFEKGKGQTNPKVRGTYWAAYNAITEWVDYQRGGDANRLNEAWFGAGQGIKNIALDKALAFAKAA
jgi:hypothetical protein